MSRQQEFWFPSFYRDDSRTDERPSKFLKVERGMIMPFSHFELQDERADVEDYISGEDAPGSSIYYSKLYGKEAEQNGTLNAKSHLPARSLEEDAPKERAHRADSSVSSMALEHLRRFGWVIPRFHSAEMKEQERLIDMFRQECDLCPEKVTTITAVIRFDSALSLDRVFRYFPVNDNSIDTICRGCFSRIALGSETKGGEEVPYWKHSATLKLTGGVGPDRTLTPKLSAQSIQVCGLLSAASSIRVWRCVENALQLAQKCAEKQSDSVFEEGRPPRLVQIDLVMVNYNYSLGFNITLPALTRIELPELPGVRCSARFERWHDKEAMILFSILLPLRGNQCRPTKHLPDLVQDDPAEEFYSSTSFTNPTSFTDPTSFADPAEDALEECPKENGYDADSPSALPLHDDAFEQEPEQDLEYATGKRKAIGLGDAASHIVRLHRFKVRANGKVQQSGCGLFESKIMQTAFVEWILRNREKIEDANYGKKITRRGPRVRSSKVSDQNDDHQAQSECQARSECRMGLTRKRQKPRTSLPKSQCIKKV